MSRVSYASIDSEDKDHIGHAIVANSLCFSSSWVGLGPGRSKNEWDDAFFIT